MNVEPLTRRSLIAAFRICSEIENYDVLILLGSYMEINYCFYEMKSIINLNGIRYAYIGEISYGTIMIKLQNNSHIIITKSNTTERRRYDRILYSNTIDHSIVNVLPSVIKDDKVSVVELNKTCDNTPDIDYEPYETYEDTSDINCALDEFLKGFNINT